MSRFSKWWHSTLRRPFRLAYADYPGEQLPVILLHGVASGKEFWQPLAGLLSRRGHRIIAPDLLGHGASPAPDYIQYSTDDQARAVLDLLNTLKVRQCVLVGHSMGSLVASRISKLEPARVKRLLLYEPPLFADIPEFRTHARRRQFYFGIYDRIAANPAARVTLAKIVAKVADNWRQYLESEQTWLPIERSLRNVIMKQTSYEELKDITVETDIIHGRLDVIVTRSGIKKMLKHNTKVRFYKTTDRHGISKVSAKFLADLIAPTAKVRNNIIRKRGNHASNLE